MPKVSIIVPVYNVNNYVRDCITSCLNQSFKDIEIIIVDDGSNDGSSETIDTFRYDSRVEIIHKSNEGVVAARNDGLKIAKSEYVFFVDGDDNIPTNTIEKLYACIEQYPNADFVLGDIMLTDSNNKPISSTITQNTDIIQGEENIFVSIMQTQFKSLCAKLIKKELFNTIKYTPYGLRIGEDLVILFQLALSAKISVHINCIVYNYVQQCKSVSNDKKLYKSKSEDWLCMTMYFENILNDYKTHINIEGEKQLKKQIIFNISRYIFINNGAHKHSQYIKKLFLEYYIKDKQVQCLIYKYSKVYANMLFIIQISPRFWALTYKLALKLNNTIKKFI